ncbi:YggS family pyridoxal phosphate-dependent enzyme [Legionella sp. km772]|uniref:YggS family pyridoxal phosphate-dependent enzyme n=1 Tax=Legionella sp. km772 TaxID=2498111 RepID=UPI000F8C5ECE|nr:YggS family pyridoxal phosphate-dependent enzyme [Legionella sp. km772]RUR09163.1 YggS family pyridoxal phosphate-dependent enzyme [Legionella sp. km772]
MAIAQRIQLIQQLIKETAQSCGREPESILLLAVSKQQNIDAINEAYHSGLCHFGENYYQEAEKKIQALKSLPLSWHFIGPLQSNKTKGIARLFSWVHSINRLSIAELLSKHRPPELPPLNVCLQINVVDEPSKSGIPIEEAHDLAKSISQLPQLKLRGLMTIPPPQNHPEQQFHIFSQLKQLKECINKDLNLNMDSLSMGMSDDLIPAINAGATIVRIGRALFGER